MQVWAFRPKAHFAAPTLRRRKSVTPTENRLSRARSKGEGRRSPTILDLEKHAAPVSGGVAHGKKSIRPITGREAVQPRPSPPRRKALVGSTRSATPRGESVSEAPQCATLRGRVRLPLAAPNFDYEGIVTVRGLALPPSHGTPGVVACTPVCDSGSSSSILERYPTLAPDATGVAVPLSRE